MSSEGSPVHDRRGALDGSGLRVALIVARFNAEITDRLLAGARAALGEHGVTEADVDVVHVPGAWELPQVAAKAVAAGRHDAIVTLGCVIRGETPHFEYVCQQVTHGLGAVARASPVPVVFGVLTTDDVVQASARSTEGPDNKGYETALAALEMALLYRELFRG